MASSPPYNPSSSGTCNEIVPVGDTSHTSSSSNTTQIDEPTTTTTNRSHSEAEALSKLIKADLNSIDTASERITKYRDQIKPLWERFENLEEEARGSADEYRELKKMVKKLKKQISSKHMDEPDESDAALHVRSNGSANINGANAGNNEAIEQSWNSEQFLTRYRELELQLRFCLLCFSVFPENVEINKRVMIYWWIGEGFVPPIGSEGRGKTPEQFANEFFDKLIEKGFIETVCKNPRLGMNICKMNPSVRPMVIEIAKGTNFFNFDDESNAEEYYHSDSLRACLKGGGLTKIQDLGKLHTLFNVDETILDFKPEWFSTMKNVKVLYLGRWQTSPTHHIEVEDITAMKKRNANVLDGLENVIQLQFLSLQGISRVTELPRSILKLKKLTILDIRACHNLQVIPNQIRWLKNLTHLDMSECYLLDLMPKGLASLSKLEVLSGFVVGDSRGSCTLDDLRKLKKLRKLSIHTGVNAFPSDTDLSALSKFKALTKLTIAWGRGSVKPAAEQGSAATKNALKRTLAFKRVSNAELPSGLIKLDLQCFPRMNTPSWLSPLTLKNLKKLYIRGGKFSDLGQFQKLNNVEKAKWVEVKELRLKYLNDLEMDWSELLTLFPNLNYLEKIKCPKLPDFPPDGIINRHDLFFSPPA
ncbi:Disease resistance RPP13-like protein 4 [Camellia lanceoleosa]|uniref:Disease resistance RPP13-like protein 4 n=1 Tax=Camellia lanceoleosa TaxID=1840588 RepID=A0ACC0GFN5_9ERIC|nr:Disease resistance RPP13-like protein 4 [Camellia lanceoleosa]